MPKFITIGYGSGEGYEQTPEPIRAEAHKHDEKLKKYGAVMGIAGSPVQVRNPNAEGLQTSAGPFMTFTLPLAGFAVLEAQSLEDAIAMVSKTPCAVAQGVVEVWPLEES